MADEHLNDISQYVHPILKRLKMGETGTVAATKQFPIEELQMYVQAYAMHKEKWFDTKYDATSKILYCTRVTPMPWDIPDEVDDDEEV